MLASTAFCALLLADSLRAERIDEPKATKVKSAYLYNFAKFINWPDRALGGRASSFVIAVLDDEPFARNLEATVHGKSVANRAVEVRRLAWANRGDRARLAACHILYVGHSMRHRLREILAALKGQPVLVVSDIRDFATEGGMIGFVLQQGRIVFEINRSALKSARLEASAKLLKLAKIVETRVAVGSP